MTLTDHQRHIAGALCSIVRHDTLADRYYCNAHHSPAADEVVCRDAQDMAEQLVEEQQRGEQQSGR